MLEIPKKEEPKEERKTRTSQYLLAKALKSTGSPSKLAEALHTSRGTVHNRLKTLEKSGFAISVFGAWELTIKGERSLLGEGGGKRRTLELRPHHLTIAVAHRTPQDIWRKKFQGSIIKLYVPALDIEVSFMFTPKGVQFHLEQERTTNLMRDVETIQKRVYASIQHLERVHKCRFVRPSDIGTKKLYEELAYLKTGLAENEIQLGRKLWFYNWEDDGKPRFLFDKSKTEEFENVGLTVDDDALETAYFLEKLGKGHLREAITDIEALKQYVPEIARSLNKIAFEDRTKKLLDDITQALFLKQKGRAKNLLRQLALLDGWKAEMLEPLVMDVIER